MKNNMADIVVAENKAIAYVCTMEPLSAKRTLFALTLLKGDERLSESKVDEVRTIALFYDGVIQAKYARELAAKIAKVYSERNPRTLLTKKEIERLADARYKKLLEALGEYGFDYVLSALSVGKSRARDLSSGINEKGMVNALRWKEKRENVDAEESDRYHRKSGLKMLGFDSAMAEILWKHSFAIANAYELVVPSAKKNDTGSTSQAEEISAADTIHMKIHFLKKREMLAGYYALKRPEIPEGYFEEDLREDTIIYALAKKGKLSDSDAVLSYVAASKEWESFANEMKKEFSEDEMSVVNEKADKVKELIVDEW